MQHVVTRTLLFSLFAGLWVAPAAAWGQGNTLLLGEPVSRAEQQVLNAVLLYASFDDAVRGDRGVGRLLMGTRSGPPGDPARQQFRLGYPGEAYRIAAGAGISGGALEGGDVLPESGRMFFPGDGHLAFRQGGWGGAVQFWLKTDPDKILKTPFCDPVQITSKSAHDGGLWIDFPDEKPRSMRMGMFPGLAAGEKPIPESAPNAPLIHVPRIGFRQTDWHHIVMTWENFDTGRPDAHALLYVDGKLAGERKDEPIALAWNLSRVGIFVAVNYIGLLDELATFDRLLTPEEVALLHRQPGLLQKGKDRPIPARSQILTDLINDVAALNSLKPDAAKPQVASLRRNLAARLASRGGRSELPTLLGLLASLPAAGEAATPPAFPCTAEQAAAYQQAYAQQTGLPVEVTNHVGMKFRLVPPGKFLMGSPENEPGHNSEGHDETRHPVTLTRPFYLSTTETTVGQFRPFVEAVRYETDVERAGGGNAHDELAVWKHRPGTNWQKPGFAGPYTQSDTHPVVHVSVTDAGHFCRWLTERGGEDNPAWGSYDLPTEAQWEWAARGGAGGRFWWGDELETTGRRANMGDQDLLAVHPKWPRQTLAVNDGHAFLAPVGSFDSNPFGLADMLGNVWEFCSTRYADYPEEPVIDPVPANPARGYAVRGGGWSNIPAHCRLANRNADPPHFGHSNLGFRVAIQLPEPPTQRETHGSTLFGTIQP